MDIAVDKKIERIAWVLQTPPGFEVRPLQITKITTAVVL
jgi:hypothetical protein